MMNRVAWTLYIEREKFNSAQPHPQRYEDVDESQLTFGFPRSLNFDIQSPLVNGAMILTNPGRLCCAVNEAWGSIPSQRLV